jgi:aspartate carbamoyltransferase regulatory subunit
MNEKESYSKKVYSIENGTVIDHIKEGMALKVMELLGIMQNDDVVIIGIRLDSSKMGRKDIIKIENMVLSKEQLDKIAIVSPNATINIIEDSRVARKFMVELPETLVGIIKCRNPKCISRNEPVISRFVKFSDSPLKVKCTYCEKVFANFELL